jgi:hypothetical protein
MPRDFDRPDDRMKGPPVPGSRRNDDFDRPEDDGPDGGIPEPVDAPARVPTKTGRRHPCPACGSHAVAEIRYGYAEGDWSSDPAYVPGEHEMGGCCIWPDAPDFHCHACDHQWSDRPPESGPGDSSAAPGAPGS